MIWKCQTVTGIFNRNNGTNATQKQKPQTIKSKLVVWDFCFCRIYFLSCAWHTGGADRGNGYASSGVLPENLGNAGSGNRAESAFPCDMQFNVVAVALKSWIAINSEKHPWWILNDSILIQCPENWVHIVCPVLLIQNFTAPALPCRWWCRWLPRGKRLRTSRSRCIFLRQYGWSSESYLYSPVVGVFAFAGLL